MCVEPVIMEFLALSSKVRRTYISKQKHQIQPLEFYHKALKTVLKDLLHLEKNKEGLQVNIPGLGIVYLHV
jgi:hypothetical protein